MYGYRMMDNYDWGWGFGMTFFGFLLFLVVTLMIIRLFRSHDTVNLHKTTPLDIIKERYAKGEITKEQFVELKKDLN